MWMNEWEVEEAVARFGPDTPVLQAGAATLASLVKWTNANSDGWPYYQKPANAARNLMALLHAADRYNPVDVTEADLVKTYRPIKAFCTRQGVNLITRRMEA